MIIDNQENWKTYPFGPAWRAAFEFLLSLTPDTEEKKYPLQGDDLFATVSAYDTRPWESALPEAHRRYVDIQMILSGRERAECMGRESLVVESPYDDAKDVEFYRHPSTGKVVIDLFPGRFAVFFPHDAHTPGLVASEGPEPVRKVVVKLRATLLQTGGG